MLIPFISLTLLLLALGILYLAAKRQGSMGLPEGRIIYADTQHWAKVKRPLYDRELELSGRPDYLIRKGKLIIPVEVKSTQVKTSPHEAHIWQLAAYCRLVEKDMGTRPPYGVLHYPNVTFAVDFTPKLEQDLIRLLRDIRLSEQSGDVSRSHNNPNRCLHCSYRSTCDETLSHPQKKRLHPL